MMRRVRGYFVRRADGGQTFVLRREHRADASQPWEPTDDDTVEIDVAVIPADSVSAVAAQHVAAQLWTHAAEPSPPAAEPETDDEEVLDVIELGSPPTTDPMQETADAEEA